MSNKHFFIFLGAIVAVFVGWLYYDSTTLSAFDQRMPRDVLTGDTTGVNAQIQYLFNFPEVVYDHVHSIPEIEALSSKLGEERDFHVPALTQAEFGLKTYYQFSYYKGLFQENYRMWIKNLKVDFSYSKLIVYITASYPMGSCEYETTRDHEDQHVAIHKRIYEKYKKILQNSLAHAKEIPLADHPVTVRSVEAGKVLIADLLSKATDPIFERFQNELSEEQSKLDSPENYGVLKSRCSNW